MAGYIFGGGTGLTPEQLRDRRAYANALAQSVMGSRPQNFGEGLGAMMQGAAVGMSRMGGGDDPRQAALQAAQQGYPQGAGYPPAGFGGNWGQPAGGYPSGGRADDANYMDRQQVLQMMAMKTGMPYGQGAGGQPRPQMPNMPGQQVRWQR